MAVRVQREDFDLGAELAAIRAEPPAPARWSASPASSATRRGAPRRDGTRALSRHDRDARSPRSRREARARWPLDACLIIHRFGRLAPGEQIMMVATASAHRAAAFAAAEFLMDYLKSRAPFWKKETGRDGTRWVEAKPARRGRAGAGRSSRPS